MNRIALLREIFAGFGLVDVNPNWWTTPESAVAVWGLDPDDPRVIAGRRQRAANHQAKASARGETTGEKPISKVVP